MKSHHPGYDDSYIYDLTPKKVGGELSTHSGAEMQSVGGGSVLAGEEVMDLSCKLKGIGSASVYSNESLPHLDLSRRSSSVGNGGYPEVFEGEDSEDDECVSDRAAAEATEVFADVERRVSGLTCNSSSTAVPEERAEYTDNNKTLTRDENDSRDETESELVIDMTPKDDNEDTAVSNHNTPYAQAAEEASNQPQFSVPTLRVLSKGDKNDNTIYPMDGKIMQFGPLPGNIAV